jgi:hypothetical protein
MTPKQRAQYVNYLKQQKVYDDLYAQAQARVLRFLNMDVARMRSDLEAAADAMALAYETAGTAHQTALANEQRRRAIKEQEMMSILVVVTAGPLSWFASAIKAEAELAKVAQLERNAAAAAKVGNIKYQAWMKQAAQYDEPLFEAAKAKSLHELTQQANRVEQRASSFLTLSDAVKDTIAAGLGEEFSAVQTTKNPPQVTPAGGPSQDLTDLSPRGFQQRVMEKAVRPLLSRATDVSAGFFDAAVDFTDKKVQEDQSQQQGNSPNVVPFSFDVGAFGKATYSWNTAAKTLLGGVGFVTQGTMRKIDSRFTQQMASDLERGFWSVWILQNVPSFAPTQRTSGPRPTSPMGESPKWEHRYLGFGQPIVQRLAAVNILKDVSLDANDTFGNEGLLSDNTQVRRGDGELADNLEKLVKWAWDFKLPPWSVQWSQG